MRHLKSFLTVSALLAAACSSDDSVTARRTPLGLRLSLTPSVDSIILGAPLAASTTTLLATATAHSSRVELPGHVFEAGDSNVVALFTRDSTDSLVTVRPRAVGTSTVTVRVNDERATATIVVLPLVKSITVKASATQALVGDTIIVSTTSFGWDGDTVATQTTLYSSSSPSAIVTPTGRVVFVAPGSATITARNGEATASVVLTGAARQFIGGGSSTLSTGNDATCGLLPLGRTFCYGKAPLIGVAKDTACFDQAPAGVSPCTLVPLPIALQLPISLVAVGDSVACGLVAAGQVYCWGDQTYGQIGNGISKPGTSALPMRATGPLVEAATFTQITTGGAHACGIITDGRAYCWGKDVTLQLGGGDNIAVNSSTPIQVMSTQNLRFRALSAGRNHTCGIQQDGVTICWGDNLHGQLGRGTVGGVTDTPAPVSGGLQFTQISARGDNTCGLTSAGTIYCWGANSTAQTGQAASDSVPAPAQVPGSGYTYVSVGGRDTTRALGTVAHACALQGASVVCWGSNRYGQLGRGGPVNDGTPTPAPVIGLGTVTSVSSGTRTTCANTTAGVYCWGSSIFGATGNQSQALAVTTPQLVAPPR